MLSNQFLYIGSSYVNVDHIEGIEKADAGKVRKYCRDRNIMKNYMKGASDKETRSMIILTNGVVCSSKFTAEDLLRQVEKMREPVAKNI